MRKTQPPPPAFYRFCLCPYPAATHYGSVPSNFRERLWEDVDENVFFPFWIITSLFVVPSENHKDYCFERYIKIKYIKKPRIH